MSRSANPFRAGVVLGIVLLGAAAFLLMLYAMGQGWDGRDERDGRAHALANGLNGFAGIVALAQAEGFYTEIGYNEARLDDYPLVVLTPQHFADVEQLNEIIEQRRFAGPTMIILPKWLVSPVSQLAEGEHEPGWVELAGMREPGWFAELDLITKGEFADVELGSGETKAWSGFGETGALPDAKQVQGLRQNSNDWITPLVVDSEGDLLAARFDDAGDDEAWPVTFVFEPDLMNNYGLADYDRAQVALALLDTAAEGESDIVFDVSLAGLGRSENLLTLVFAPPFLAATLCLILAAIVIGWRAFRRFGPPHVPAPAFAQGKRALARNGAALIARVRRWHLLAGPYADLVTARLAKSLAIRSPEPAARIAAIDAALLRAGYAGPSFGKAVHELRDANHPRDILRGARLLRDMERTLKR